MSVSRRIHELHTEARALWRAERIAEAERVFRTMADLVHEAADAAPVALRADVHHWTAHFYRDTGRITEAEVFAREAILLEEQTGRTAILANHRMFLAHLLGGRGEVREALAHAELALDAERAAMGEEHSETRYYASVVAKLRQRLDEA